MIEEEDDREDGREEKDMAILKSHVAQLCEHFDTIHVFATRQDSERGVTVNAQTGDGNWYARFGQIGEWLACENERARHNTRENP